MGRRSKKRLLKRKSRKTHRPASTTQTISPTPAVNPTSPPPILPQTKSTSPKSTSPSLTRLESFLFQLLVFLIPTNLSLHFFQDQAHVYGILVDYLIPKLYLSDLVIFSLFLIWLLKSLLSFTSKQVGGRRRGTPIENRSEAGIADGGKRLTGPAIIKSIRNFPKPHVTCYLLLATTLLISAALSPKPVAAFWYLAKLLEMFLLFKWIKTHVTNLDSLRRPLIITTLFQSTLALIQWVQKKSLLGYLFLGETTLKTSSLIAKTDLNGEVRPLPYGTTPHPNVLAGFLVISLLILYLIKITQSRSNPFTLKGLSLQAALRELASFLLAACYLLLVLAALVLTQSLSAGFVLVIGLILITPLIPKYLKIFLIAGLFSALFVYLGNLDISQTPSLSRRYLLGNISIRMIRDHLLLGVGPNNFTALMNQYGTIPGNTRFFQPVHNIYLLWLAETGLLGTLPLGLIIWFTKKNWFSALKNASPSRLQPSGGNWSLKIPLLMLCLIGLIDHYPTTLQTGQLLLVLTATLATLKSRHLETTFLVQTTISTL